MTTITIHHHPHHHFGVPAPRIVRTAAIALAIVTLGFVASSAFGNTNAQQGPPSSIETLADMNRDATATAAAAPAPQVTTAPSSLDVLSAMNGE